MKSKVWALKFFGHPSGSGYFQAADMKFYDLTSTLIDTSSATVWVRDPYTTAGANHVGSTALFDGNLATWTAMPDQPDGNLMIIKFPAAVDVGSFSVTTRIGSVTRGTIALYKVISTPDDFYDIFANQDELILVNTWGITSTSTQATFTFDIAAVMPYAKVPTPYKAYTVTSGTETVDKNLPSFVPATSVQQMVRRDSYAGDGFIEGQVTDAIGSAVENAKLQLVESIRRNYVAETFSDSLGAYRFDNLKRDGTLFDVIADSGEPDLEKLVSSRRMPLNAVAHTLSGDAKRGSMSQPAYLNNKPVISANASKRKGTGGLAILNQKDPFHDKTFLLLDVNATTISDKSSLALPFTQDTLTIASTNSPPIGTYSVQLAPTTSGYFAGLEDRYDRDLTIEYYVRVASVALASRLLTIGMHSYNGTVYGSQSCTLDTARMNYFEVGNINAYARPFTDTGNILTANTWYHVAWVKQGDNYTLYRDGTQISTATYRVYPIDLRTATKTIYLGATASNFSAQLAGVRMTSAARYTTGFTPPTASDLYG
jgi:hypothetical protein